MICTDIKIELHNMKDLNKAFNVGQKKAREEAKERGLDWLNISVSVIAFNHIHPEIPGAIWRKEKGSTSLVSVF